MLELVRNAGKIGLVVVQYKSVPRSLVIEESELLASEIVDGLRNLDRGIELITDNGYQEARSY